MLKQKKVISILATMVLLLLFLPANETFATEDDEIPFWNYEPTTDEEKPFQLSDDKVGETISSVTDGEWQGIDGQGVKTIKDKVKGFVGIIAVLLFGFAVIMVTFAGFTYATSEGDERKTRQAKTQILTAGVGIGLGLFNLLIVELFATIINTFN